MTISKYGLTPQLSSIAKKVAWTNIFIQFVFPIAASIPANVFASENVNENQFINKTLLRNLYQVKDGDTPESIAKNFNIKLSKLIEANPDYVSLVGRLKIKTGITLNIPNNEPRKGKWLNNISQNLPEISSDGKELAQLIVNNSALLNKETNASQYAISQVTNKANEKIEQWLNQFGHARVLLSTDKNFTLESSSADLLIPLYDQEKNLVFSQTSYHRKDSRSQINQGIGYRHFTERFMLGINAFYDYDLSRYHSRFGIGAEVWRNYFKLSANHYHRISNWRTSDDVMDYNERPANGWDIRTEGYLPAYPQLGAKLIFEQYYGKEVGLFGKDNRQENPHAYTAGLTYTPVPLITFGAERRFGLHEQSDNKFDVNVQYRLGESLSSQLNSDNVRAMRLMSGSRYDFVDRNNDIVLEYKKKTLVFLSVASSIAGYAKEEKDLAVQVRSKYPVKQIEWSASGLIANGGKIKNNNNFNYSVILPNHISGSNNKNSYTISAVAIDEKGNRSDPVQSKITVVQSAINTQNSQFEPGFSQLPADGHTQQQLVLSIFDNDNLPVDININELSVKKQTDNSTSGSTLSQFSRIDSGKYQITVTAGSSPEKLILTPYFRDNIFESAEINFHADTKTIHIAKGNLTVIKDNSPADGISENKIKVIVTDINNNPVINYPIRFSADNGAKIIPIGYSGFYGEAQIPITNTTAGITNIKVSVADIDYPISVNFVADQNTAYIPRSLLTIKPDISPADNATEKEISLAVIDKNDNPVPNIKVILRANNHAQVKDKIVTTDKDGKASTTMVSQFAGDVLLKAEVTHSHEVTEATTTFIGNLSNGQIVSITPSAPPYIADGKTKVTFTAKVTDNFNNPLPNALILWSTDRDKNVVNIQNTSSTNINGITKITLTSTQALDVVVTATTNNHSLSAAPITFIADNQQGLITLSSDKTQLIADDQEHAILTATVKDKFGNKLPNVIVEWQSNSAATLNKQKTTTNNQGQTSNQVSTKVAGNFDVTAKLTNNEKTQITLNAIANPNSAKITLTTVNNKTQAIADNNDSITLLAHVSDKQNNPLIKHAVFWRSNHNNLSENMVKTDNNGDVKITIKGTQALLTTITATLANKQTAAQDVYFISGVADPTHSIFTLDPQSIIANGQSLATGTLILKDKFDNPISKQQKFISLTGDNSTIQFSGIKETANGIYQTTIRGKKEGVSIINAKYTNTNNTFTLTQPLGFIADKQNATIQAVNVVAPFDVTANDADKVTIRAKIVDKQGNPSMEGVAVGWLTSLGKLSSPISKTDKNGIAEIALTSRQIGSAQVTAMLDSQQSLDADHIIIFNADVISADKSQLFVSPNTIISGTDKSLITVKLEDKNNNLLTGLANKITINHTTDLTFTTSSFTEKEKGVYQAQISALKTGNTILSATVNSTLIKQTAPLAVLPDAQSAKVSKFDISDTKPHAGDTIIYKAYLVDNNNNPLNSGVAVTWTTDRDSLLSQPLTFTDNKGIAQVKLTRNPAGLSKVNAVLNTGTFAAPDVNFVADDVDENRSEITLLPATIIANGKDKALLSLIIKDKGGNILPDQQVKGISNNPTIVFGAAKQVSPGHYEIEATGTKSGTANLSVNINGTDFKKQKSLQLNADPTTWKIKSTDVDRTSIIAGDKGVNYQATIIDANDNILPNVIVSWKLLGLADDYDFSTYTDAKGVARTNITSKVAGILKVSAYLDLSNHQAISDVTVLPADIDANKSTLTTNRQSIGGDDKDQAILTVKLVDKYDNTIDGKTVSLTATTGTAHFSDNPLKSLRNGQYQTKLTSNVKTDITLAAEAEGIAVAKPVIIKVTIPKPEIIFDKKIQQEIYASLPINALTFKGLPNNVDKMWSSSDPSIASIDSRKGTISMKKAGTVSITLQTAGDDHYLPAESSYPLVIEKADIGLSTKNTQINSTWDDGITQNISTSYSNSDGAINPPPLQFISLDDKILSIDNQGKITAIKPGDTKINVVSEATEQFKSSTITVNYHQEKGTLNYTFKDQVVALSDDYTNNGPIEAQKTINPIPSKAQAVWRSDNPNVVNITPDGMITKLSVGSTKLILEVLNNNYYQDYNNSYSVNVAKTPKINIDQIEFISMDAKSSETNTTNINWHPLYKTDNSFTVKWSPVGEDPHAVDFVLRDKNNTEIKRISRLNYQPTVNLKDPVVFNAIPENYLNNNNTLVLEVNIFDLNNKSYKKFYNINISGIDAQSATTLMNINKNSIFIHTFNGSSTTTHCQYPSETEPTHLFIKVEVSLHRQDKELLYPIKLNAKIRDVTLGGSDAFVGTIIKSVDYPDSYTFHKNLSEKITFYYPSSIYAIDRECRNTDSGTGNLIIELTVNGNKSQFKQGFSWSGASNITK